MTYAVLAFWVVLNPDGLGVVEALTMLLFAVLLWFTRRPRPTWAASGVFALGYGLLRSVAEFFREPDAHLGFQAFGWVTRGQLLSLPLIAVGLFLLWLAYGANTLSECLAQVPYVGLLMPKVPYCIFVGGPEESL